MIEPWDSIAHVRMDIELRLPLPGLPDSYVADVPAHVWVFRDRGTLYVGEIGIEHWIVQADGKTAMDGEAASKRFSTSTDDGLLAAAQRDVRESYANEAHKLLDEIEDERREIAAGRRAA